VGVGFTMAHLLHSKAGCPLHVLASQPGQPLQDFVVATPVLGRWIL